MNAPHPIHSLVVALAATTLLSACGGGGSAAGGEGSMRLALTDAPACGFDAVNVTIDRIRVHQSSSAQDGDGGWSELVLSPARRVNLLDLTNGVLEELGQTSLPAGTYTQMRLVLAPNATDAPMANAVTPTGGTETALTTPSGTQSGLKMNVNLEVAPDKLADFVIDFDACKSIVRRGNSGQYNLKPVLSVIPRLSDAGQRVVGYVVPALANAQTQVSLQVGGVVQKATPPDATGRFVLYPVPPGTYDMVVTAPGRVNAVMTGVPVTSTAITTTNPDTVRIDPPASAVQRKAQGTVAVSGSATVPAASVRVVQALSAGALPIEVANQPVDALSGAYLYLLPVEAPVRTAYVANPTSLAFAADGAAAAHYTVEAMAEGRPTQSASIDLSASDVTTPLLFPAP